MNRDIEQNADRNIDRKQKIEALIGQMTLDEKISLITGKNSWQTQEIERLSIPSITMSDGTNGVRFQKGSDSAVRLGFLEAIQGSFDNDEAIARTYEATCFPTGSAAACSWDRQLLEEIGSAIADECRDLGIDLLLGPGMNIRRHPLTARNYEYYSEDPCLSGEMAASMVNGIQKQGVGACVKHYVCHNSDSYRTRVNSNVGERALNEIYLAGFERAVKKAGPVSLMTAYNQVNRIEVSGDSPLVKEVLKRDWEYDGAVISDWGAVKDIVEATKGGLDLQMPYSPASMKRLNNAVISGVLSEPMVDDRVRRVLNLVFRLQEMHQDKSAPSDRLKHHELARRAAAESMVLLKNEDTILPIELKHCKKIAVLGLLAEEPAFQGTGCSIIHTDHVDIPLDLIRESCKESIEVVYAPGYKKDGTTDDSLLCEAVGAARDSETVLIFAGNLSPAESDDYNRKDMSIAGGHERLIREVSKVNSNVVVVLANGESVEMAWADGVKGILDTWYGGEGMGAAVVDILFGKKNPCGKLSATIPVKMSDTPAYLGFTGNKFEMDYGEGIYAGYRYYDKKELEPAFPFGFGLSYTTFSYGDLKIEGNGSKADDGSGEIRVTANITNTGSRQGKEIVELYISQKNPKEPRPVRELKGFEKVELKPGESRKVTFVLTERDFAYYSLSSHQFVTDQDTYTVEIGASSRDIRLSKDVWVLFDSGRNTREILRDDCGFTELFADKKREEKFFDFLVEQGLIQKDQADGEMRERMITSFWPVRVYMDMNAGGEIDWDTMKRFMEQASEE